MNNYIPFLKVKTNEIGALKELDPALKGELVPFFDLARKDGMTEDSYKTMVQRCTQSLKRNLKDFGNFFVDNFDIEDHITVDGKNNYGFLIDNLAERLFIPVVGLDRVAGRNEIVFNKKKGGLIKSDAVALRLQADDFENFALVQKEIGDLIQQGNGIFSSWILILDNRLCLNMAHAARANLLASFIKKAAASYNFSMIVVTGSSIPSSIGDIQKAKSEQTHDRPEVAIFRTMQGHLGQIFPHFGDYTIVSPLYSDLAIPPEAMQNVTAAKVIYSHADVHYIARGGALKGHPRGYLQYNDIAQQIVAKIFYRKPPYSFGDKFLNEKANFMGSKVTASSILKPTINAHITYMLKDFKI